MNQPTRRTVLCALLAATALHRAGAATVDAAGFVDQLGQRTIAALDRLGGDPAARRQAISALLDETVDQVTCRWCGTGTAVETIETAPAGADPGAT